MLELNEISLWTYEGSACVSRWGPSTPLDWTSSHANGTRLEGEVIVGQVKTIAGILPEFLGAYEEPRTSVCNMLISTAT